MTVAGDGRPIGVFDSGIGGLTIVRALQERLPHEQIIYVGDTAHLPYGDKSPEVLKGYVAQIVRFLLKQDVKAVVTACNTASAAAYDVVQALAAPLAVPTYEVIRPAVQLAIAQSAHARIGVIGTRTTIQSHVYLRELLTAVPDASVIEKATPLLVPMIEEGWHQGRLSREVIEAYLSDTGFKHIDTLILGCTHYPLIEEQIVQYLNDGRSQTVAVINSARAVADSVARDLTQRGMRAPESDQPPEHVFYASDITEAFQQSAALFLGRNVTLQPLPHGHESV